MRWGSSGLRSRDVSAEAEVEAAAEEHSDPSTDVLADELHEAVEDEAGPPPHAG